MNSVIGRNVQLCSEKYRCRVSDLTLNFTSSFIDDMCRSNIDREMFDRSIFVS